MKKNTFPYPFVSSQGIKKLLLTMKITLFLSLFCIINLSAENLLSQSITINLKNTPVKEIFKAIEEQTQYRFFYNDELSDVNRLVSVNIAGSDINTILSQVLDETRTSYKVLENNLIVVAPKETLQQVKVTGSVTDAQTGEALPGVNIIVQGTTIGVTTDISGNYAIELPNSESTLVFSYIGYVTQTIKYAGQATINVALVADVKELDELVVVGYNVQKKSDVTGSLVSVSNEQLTSNAVNNVIEALQGKAAGVDITASMRPGTIGDIKIRGLRSIRAGNNPLYVVDGIPLQTAGIETLNPADIESIDILKDASATAIYGSRGANGVLLITTKRGKSGKLTVNYSGSLTSTEMVWRTKYMGVSEYIDFIRWGSYNQSPANFTRGDEPSLANDAKITLFTADPVAWANIQKGWDGTNWDPSRIQTFDWIGEVTQPNLAQEHTISASGGNETVRAYGSIGYFDNQGTTKGQEYQRYTVKTSIDLDLKKWLKFGTSINGSWEFQDYGQANVGSSMSSAGDLIASAAKIYPYALPYDDLGNRVSFPGGQSRVATVLNEWQYSTNQREVLRILGSFYTEISILKGLKYRLNFGPDIREYRNGVYNDGKSVVRGGSAYARYGGSRHFSWTLDNLIYYDKTIGSHEFGVTLLQSASKLKNEGYHMDAQGIATAEEQWYALETVSALQSWNTDLLERQMVSYMGRINYTYNNKYILTASGRWDGSSVLADGNKWSFFPSFAVAWRADQEPFLKEINWLNQLKLRLGYGSSGNQAVDPYTTKGEITSYQQPFGNTIVTGYNTSWSLSNLGLGWERTTTFNYGIDFGFMNNRINGSIEYFNTRTTDLLLTTNLPSVSGFTTTIDNIGETKNEGFEITLNSVNVKLRNFTWETNTSAAFQKDEIVSLMNGKEDMVADTLFIGESIKSHYNYERIGLWQDTPEDLAEIALFNANGHQFQPGMVRVKDQNGDHRITANDDRVIVGNARPRWSIGINNTFTYKNLDLSIFLIGRFKYKVAIGEGLTGMYGDQRSLDYWTPVNTGAEYQKPFRNEAGGDTYAFTYYKDDSYIKIRNISLGYKIPKKFIKKIAIDNARVYVQSRNTGMLWSNNKFRDAEFGTLYYDRGWVFGLNVGF